jgi:hypothetical protein
VYRVGDAALMFFGGGVHYPLQRTSRIGINPFQRGSRGMDTEAPEGGAADIAGKAGTQ